MFGSRVLGGQWVLFLDCYLERAVVVSKFQNQSRVPCISTEVLTGSFKAQWLERGVMGSRFHCPRIHENK